ncbi:MAG: hypothetical protein GX178_07630 [Acidobacteria bacterium]|nr:hypothetical protein [Thermoanaerobaculia bacterium]NLN11463.1 hypothetical protein [Acidobacteriota bacterium]MBP7812763.1 hypothetical protein [Thermoanaerobaculia bacterium]MBP8845003.1 hypothetical protein [Thermoanaerobaculia bacterium]HPA96151.1 hypothetical protein [Thermoanaerobaculia bacterium]
MRRPLSLSLLLFVLVSPNGAAAAGDAPTIGAVHGNLLDSLARLRAATGGLPPATRTAVARLEVSAGAVVAEIETRLAGQFERRPDRLDATERQLVADAVVLAERIEAATASLASLSGADARQLVGDADILAYDAVHALPCHAQRPRLVYVTPEELALNGKPAEVRIRGNYLAFGAEPEIRVEWQPALLLARGANELHLRLPQALFRNLEAPRPVTVRFRPTAMARTCYLWGLLPWSSLVAAEQELTATVVLRPGDGESTRERAGL